MKKILLGLGAVASVIAPVASVIACGTEMSGPKNYDVKKFSLEIVKKLKINDQDKTKFVSQIESAKTEDDIETIVALARKAVTDEVIYASAVAEDKKFIGEFEDYLKMNFKTSKIAPSVFNPIEIIDGDFDTSKLGFRDIKMEYKKLTLKITKKAGEQKISYAISSKLITTPIKGSWTPTDFAKEFIALPDDATILQDLYDKMSGPTATKVTDSGSGIECVDASFLMGAFKKVPWLNVGAQRPDGSGEIKIDGDLFDLHLPAGAGAGAFPGFELKLSDGRSVLLKADWHWEFKK